MAPAHVPAAPRVVVPLLPREVTGPLDALNLRTVGVLQVMRGQRLGTAETR